MKNQLKALVAAALISMAFCTTEAFASVNSTVNPDAAVASAAQNVQVADGYDFDPTESDTGM